MANLSLFGGSFTDKSPEEQLTLVKNARHLRRQRLPEKVRRAPAKKTTPKRKKAINKRAFEQMTIEEQIAILKKKIDEKKEVIDG